MNEKETQWRHGSETELVDEAQGGTLIKYIKNL